jgi:hypothetical protein
MIFFRRSMPKPAKSVARFWAHSNQFRQTRHAQVLISISKSPGSELGNALLHRQHGTTLRPEPSIHSLKAQRVLPCPGIDIQTCRYRPAEIRVATKQSVDLMLPKQIRDFYSIPAAGHIRR